ncbi:hypothetical protein GF386_06395 [Candidatus Pacearchaeota archaeon]|nr:hypothetical protein [Candidatus Pacearchaeota archaeon]MBD3283718.1 hypothetical protein [Candidatus Pacearchaeota archaeon]
MIEFSNSELCRYLQRFGRVEFQGPSCSSVDNKKIWRVYLGGQLIGEFSNVMEGDSLSFVHYDGRIPEYVNRNIRSSWGGWESKLPEDSVMLLASRNGREYLRKDLHEEIPLV